MLRATLFGWTEPLVHLDLTVWQDRGGDAWTRLGGARWRRTRIETETSEQAREYAVELLTEAGYHMAEVWTECNGVGWWAEVRADPDAPRTPTAGVALLCRRSAEADS